MNTGDTQAEEFGSVLQAIGRSSGVEKPHEGCTKAECTPRWPMSQIEAIGVRQVLDHRLLKTLGYLSI